MDILISIIVVVGIIIALSRKTTAQRKAIKTSYEKLATAQGNVRDNAQAAAYVKAPTKKIAASASKTVPTPPVAPPVAPPAYNKNIAGHTHSFAKGGPVNSLMEDRQNDWLANQLREEHRAFKRTSDMFNLKIEHVAHCDAKLLHQYYNK